MANIGGFLQALGQAFGGYAQDEQTREQRVMAAQKAAMEQRQAAQEAEFRRAQMSGMQSEQAARDATTRKAAETERLLAENWTPALGGDKQAQARIVSVAPHLAPEFMPKPAQPHRQYDAERGVLVDLDNGGASPIAGLPPKATTPHAPVEGTPEYYEFLRQKLAIEGQYKAPDGPKVTDFSNKAALLYPKAEQSAKALDKYFNQGVPARSLLSRVPLVGNYGLTADEQAMNQAAEAVASAFLRLESGASISEGEIKSAAKQFLPQPGDSPNVLQQKRATLLTQLEQMKNAAAPSMSGSQRPTAPVPPPAAPRPTTQPPINDQRLPGRLTPAQVKRAASDPTYRQFLKDTGRLQ